MNEAEKNSGLRLPPRPASHRWTIGIFGFASFGFTLVLINAYTGRNGASLWAMPVMAAMFWFAILAFAALLVGQRRVWAYFIGASCLATWCIRSLQSAYYALSSDAFSSSDAAPYRIPTLLAPPLLFLLFYRFTFGTPSRSYFGLKPATTKR